MPPLTGKSGNGSGISPPPTKFGVWGDSEGGPGVFGSSKETIGVRGAGGPGVENPLGFSTATIGVHGTTSSDNDQAYGVLGEGRFGAGVRGYAPDGDGVQGSSERFTGVSGRSRDGIGVLASGGTLAGRFEGDVEVTGNVQVAGDIRLTTADFAEDFDILGADEVKPGTVMVIDQEGVLRQSQQPYDKRVAGVIAGAGDYKPGMVLDRHPEQRNRLPLALLGKVYCRVDAQYASIEVGDLLTTSPTFGHAMRAADPLRAFGAVIGKALRPLGSGRGLLPILIALQ